jgi:general secretion pathway protein C
MSFSATLRELQTLSGQQWLDRATQTLPRALTVVLVIAIAWQLVQLTWLLLERRPADSSAMVMAPPPPTATRKGIDVQAIASAHIFGTAQDEPVAAADAKETQMNLILAGVFAANDPTKGLAMIGDSPQSAKVYAVGAVVRPGTKLHSVYLDRVILDRNGQLETLSLPRPSTAGLAITRTAAAPRPGNNTQFADNLRRIAETNPTAFAEVVRPQPVFANGVQRGYRVYPGRNRQQFAKLGLQPGDLVLSINGTPLDDPQRGMEIFNTIGTSDRVSVTVERNGQSQELTLNTAQIMLPDANSPPPGRTGQPRQIQTPAFTPEPE